MNPHAVSKISLEPQLIDCIVFWTKNPKNLIPRLDQLKRYRYYFLFTITPYGPDLEKYLPPKTQIIDTFIELSRKIGKEKVNWRYDPIIITGSMDYEYHCRQFTAIAQRLRGFTGRCIISFLDMYKKCERNLKGLNIKESSPDEMTRLADALNRTAGENDMEMVTCAEEMDFSSLGVLPGKCIDAELISRIAGYPLDVKKDKHQRITCLCVESIDIGAYNTCPHICLYCYANYDEQAVRKNASRHNPGSPLLLGGLSPDDTIVERKIDSFRKVQQDLF